MTTNKPEVWAIIDKHCATGVILIQHGHEKLVDGDRLIRLSDYEALQAECDDMERDYLAIIEAQDAEHRKQTVKMQAECEKLRKELVECEARGAALSAGACHGGYGDEYGHHRCHYQNRIDHLLALLRHAYPIIKAHVGASHMLDGFRPKRNQWDELVEGIDAAIQENPK